MNSLNTPVREARAQRVTVTEDSLVVDLIDGRTITVPLVWYPRLLKGTPRERNNWRLIAEGEGIHWPDLDEDLSVDSLILGRRSGESSQSLKRWLDLRRGLTKRTRTSAGWNYTAKPSSPRKVHVVTTRKSG
jgi:hypothetical protein